MTFNQAVNYLLSLGHETLAIKLGLRNTELLLEELDNPQKSFESVQIAGTNGKGSTAVALNSMCHAAGMSTGLYTSPHLISITERIVISGREISHDDFAANATAVRAAADHLVTSGRLEALPTFFEHVTAIALLAFKKAGVKLAILETGLGGRLDSTTVAGAHTVAITPIHLDHQHYLGAVIADIAREKAAIIQPGVTTVVAPQPPEALDVILKRCEECNVVPRVHDWTTDVSGATSDGRFTVTFKTATGRYENVLLGLRGRHQITNVGVAVALAESLREKGFRLPKEAIVEGIENAEHAGRLELHPGSPSILLDGAHNVSGALALRYYLEEFGTKPLTLVFGAMRDKQLNEIASTLFPIAERVILTQSANPRAALINDLKSLAEGSKPGFEVIASESAADALDKANMMTPTHGLICVTGSLYLVGEVKGLIESEFTLAAE